MSLHGIISAMLTPFDEQGKLSLKRAEELVDYLIGSGVHGLFILGTNGEFVTLTKEEKIDLRSEEHTSELQSRGHLVCRLLLEKKKPEQNKAQLQQKTTARQ